MTGHRGPQKQRERPIEDAERAKMVRRCRSAFMDTDISPDAWERVYPASVREEVLASITPEQRHRMRELRALQRGKQRWA